MKLLSWDETRRILSQLTKETAQTLVLSILDVVPTKPEEKIIHPADTTETGEDILAEGDHS